MGILILQEAGRHVPNKHFREALSYKKAFLSIGVEAEVWGLGYENFSTPFEEMVKPYSTILLFENYDTGWVPDLSKYKDKLRINVVVDAHCNLSHLVNTTNKHDIQISLGATKGYLPHFDTPERWCYWLPNCYDDTLIYPMPSVSKSVNIGFCGNYVTEERKQWVKGLIREVGLKADIFSDETGLHYEHIGEGMVRNLNSYKIVLNKSISDDINYRNFEALGTKSFLLTNEVPGLRDLFDVGKHLEVYNNLEDLIGKLLYYSTHENERLAIAEAGYNHVRRVHTFVARAREIMLVIKNFKESHGKV